MLEAKIKDAVALLIAVLLVFNLVVLGGFDGVAVVFLGYE